MKQLVSVQEWKERFIAIGLDQNTMQKWHKLFEKENPAGHQSFLEWLGLSSDEIAAIRKQAN